LVGRVEGLDLLNYESLLDLHVSELLLEAGDEFIKLIVFEVFKEEAEVGDVELVGMPNLEPLDDVEGEHVDD
jgi:hypothetical protein